MIIALLSCGKTKAKTAVPAKHMYLGTLFSLQYQYALQHADMIYILSAKYGLLDPETIIEPYDETLLKKSKKDRLAWAERVLEVMPQADEYIFLAGAKYREFLADKLQPASVPLEGLSIGRQLQKLNQWLR